MTRKQIGPRRLQLQQRTRERAIQLTRFVFPEHLKTAKTVNLCSSTVSRWRSGADTSPIERVDTLIEYLHRMGRPRADAHLLVLHFKQTIAELYGGNTEDLDVPMNREQAADAAEDIAQMKVALGDGSPSEYRDRLTEYIANAEALLLGLPHTDRNQLTL